MVNVSSSGLISSSVGSMVIPCNGFDHEGCEKSAEEQNASKYRNKFNDLDYFVVKLHSGLPSPGVAVFGSCVSLNIYYFGT